MAPTPTHLARCSDDDLEIPLVRDHSFLCAVCEEFVEVGFLVLADGGPGSVCEPCTGDLSWEVRPV